MRRRSLTGMVAVCLLAAAGCDVGDLGGGRGRSATQPARTPAASGDDTSARELFLTRCAACHGADGAGTQLGPSLAGRAEGGTPLTPEEIAQLVLAGVPEPKDYPVPMPPAALLTDSEVRALAEYTHSLAR